MKPENMKNMLEKWKRQAGKCGKKLFEWVLEHGNMAAFVGVLAVGAVALAMAFVCGGLNSGKAPLSSGSKTMQTPSEAGSGTGQSESAIEGGKQRSGNIPTPKLEEDQIELLEGLTQAFRDRDLETGGSMLLNHEQKLDYLFYQVLGGERYLYQDGELFRELEGEGLVLTRPMAAYYGTLVDGKPEGEGIMIQGIQLDGLRYDYADGLWSEGRLHGKAEAGYHYFEGSGEGESLEVTRTGIFVDDLMDGAFTYETVNAEGETTIWDMKAERGKTKLDDGWIHDEEKQYYYLPSRELSNHTYVIQDSEAWEVRWRNMLPWEE